MDHIGKVPVNANNHVKQNIISEKNIQIYFFNKWAQTQTTVQQDCNFSEVLIMAISLGTSAQYLLKYLLDQVFLEREILFNENISWHYRALSSFPNAIHT